MDELKNPPPAATDDDTEGQAFKWQVVDDPKGGKQLRQGWTPDEPQTGRARTNTSTKGKASGGR